MYFCKNVIELKIVIFNILKNQNGNLLHKQAFNTELTNDLCFINYFNTMVSFYGKMSFGFGVQMLQLLGVRFLRFNQQCT